MSMRSVEKDEAIKYTVSVLRDMIDAIEDDDQKFQLQALTAAIIVLHTVQRPGYLINFLLKFAVFAVNAQEAGEALSDATLSTMDKLMRGGE